MSCACGDWDCKENELITFGAIPVAAVVSLPLFRELVPVRSQIMNFGIFDQFNIMKKICMKHTSVVE